MQLAIATNKRTVAHTLPIHVLTANRRTKPIHVDGHLGEWKNDRFVALSAWASMAMQWDPTGLWLALRVKDATPCSFQQAKGKLPWQGDDVELFFNPNIGRSYINKRFGPGDCQVICAVQGGGHSTDSVTAHGGPKHINTTLNPKSIRMVSQRNKVGYTTEIFFPWSNFPSSFRARPGQVIGFDVAVRNVARDYSLINRVIWSGDNDDYRYTDKYGALVLRRAAPRR